MMDQWVWQIIGCGIIINMVLSRTSLDLNLIDDFIVLLFVDLQDGDESMETSDQKEDMGEEEEGDEAGGVIDENMGDEEQMPQVHHIYWELTPSFILLPLKYFASNDTYVYEYWSSLKHCVQH